MINYSGMDKEEVVKMLHRISDDISVCFEDIRYDDFIKKHGKSPWNNEGLYSAADTHNRLLDGFAQTEHAALVLPEIESGCIFVKCPWHEEKTGSLEIDFKTGTFSCLGCGKKGHIWSTTIDLFVE